MNDEIRNEAVIYIEDMCLLMGGIILSKLIMSAPNRFMHYDLIENYSASEIAIEMLGHKQFAQMSLWGIPAKERVRYDTLMTAVDDEGGGIFFLDAPGGTGKTFLFGSLGLQFSQEPTSRLHILELEGDGTGHLTLKLSLNLQMSEEPAAFQETLRWYGCGNLAKIII